MLISHPLIEVESSEPVPYTGEERIEMIKFIESINYLLVFVLAANTDQILVALAGW